MSSTTKHSADTDQRKDYEALDPRRLEQIIDKRERAKRELDDANRELREALEAHKRLTQASGLFPAHRDSDVTTVMPTVRTRSTTGF